MNKISLTLSLFALLVSGFVFFNNGNKKGDNQSALNQTDISEGEKRVHIIDYMIQMQYFANKIYYAGINNNLDLLSFYIHEMEEVMEDLAAQDVQKNGVSVSKNLKLFGIEPLELFEQNIKISPQQFTTHYDAWVNQCNACHGVFEKSFIQITKPQAPVVTNQRFKP
ncbi:MAG: hypothetical protein ACK4K0_01885 [Flavobacteriales bacterium]